MTLPASLDDASVARGAVGRMSRLLTEPFAAGGDVLHLELTPAAGAPESAGITGYDFTDHTARFGTAPRPSYVVRTLRDLDHDTRVTVRVTDPTLPGGTADVSVVFRAGTLAGESTPVVLPAGSTDAARLVRISVARRRGPDFVAASGPADREWAVGALLGNTARLLWVLGGERDLLRRQIARTATQRRLTTALGAALDLIGGDLAVPRFPPLPYAVDDDTVALYHLDDPPGTAIGVEDFTGRFPGRTPHHGTPSGNILLGAPGRFGTAVAFTGPGAVTVTTDPAFDVPANAGLTAECFVKPEAATPDARVLARRGSGGAGWSIEVGAFGRGLARAVRATVSDGATERVLHSDRSLPTDRFTHLAVVLDRSEASVALWVDGVRVDVRDAGPLGALTMTAPLVIGPGGGTTLRASVAEVRISRAPRPDFSPVLGESDDHYRRRLRIFQRWTLPTPDRIAAVLNDVVGRIGNVTDPLVVDDADAPIIRGHRLVRVVPATLPPGQSIDAVGRRGATEEELYGDAEDLAIDPVLLLRHDRPGVAYGPVETGDPHLMQPPLASALDRLLALLPSAGPGSVRVSSAWTPGAPDARAAGRGVVLEHPAINPPRLAALAHRAGFALVRTLKLGAGVYASCAPGVPFTLGVPGAASPDGTPSVAVGASLTLTASPPPPPGAELYWSVAAGGGPGTVRALPSATPGQVTVDGLSAGVVQVSVDIVHGGFSATVSTAVRVVPTSVAAGSSIAADGTLGAGPEVAGEPAEHLDTALLDTVSDSRAAFAVPDARRMQRGVSRRLTALLDDLAGTPGTLTVLSALVPVPAGTVPTLASQGRALTLRHSALSADRLAARAHLAGFSRVAVTGTTVEVLHRAEDLIEVRGADLVEEGETASLQVVPTPSAVSATTRLSWSSGPLAPTSGQADVATTALPAVELVGRRTGWVWVQAAFREAGANGPNAMQVRLSSAVPAGSTITRDQYDLIMNVVHALHPLGVEVLTRGIRPAVVELAGSTSLDPDHTYPRFRLHRPVPRLRKDVEHG
ncbi:LamG-like jellyroll fold domain-containing protein [Streptomyces sp. NPDC001978]|uniref:LamG-like jellyroll fold domain-containing protein n=1 Tax=Streptomyces sp. NPDC001978 TaxID=3364627 RepID=UPI0036A42064